MRLANHRGGSTIDNRRTPDAVSPTTPSSVNCHIRQRDQMHSDDGQLMRRIQEGEFSLFEVLVERYRPALLRVASGMLNDAALAEDMVQETFLAVFASRHTFNPAFHFRTWLWTILLNLCRAQLKRRARRPQVLSNSTLTTSERANIADPSTSETALAALLIRERGAQLQGFLNELPEAQADAIRLRFFAGLKYEEIAQSMGVSLGGAKLRVRSGLRRLSERLLGDEEISNEL
jgi:RNA polymerase sigma-70 factor (ECF subfamily)